MCNIKLMFMSGVDDGMEMTLTKPTAEDVCTFVIGRRQGCDVSISYDTQVSREHARLTLMDDQLWLEDLASLNGTFLHRQRIWGATPITIGDIFRVGVTHLRIQEVA